MGARRNGGLRWFFPLGLAFLGTPAQAQGSVTELLVFRTGESLCVEVRAHDLLDERTTWTIDSGLPGTCVYLLRLEDRSGRLVAQRYVERSLRYDLFKNLYLLESGGDSLALPTLAAADSLALPTLAAADSAISRLVSCDLCPVSRLGFTEEYTLTLQIAVQSFAPDDRVDLSRYVGSNSAGDTEDDAVDLATLLGRSVPARERARQVIGRTSPFFRAGDLREAP